MTEDSQEHDDAYYEKLLARVDNTISDSRTRDRSDQPLNLQISNDHSISGVFFYYEEDSLTLAHRFSLMLLSITYVMFFALCTASEDTETKGFAGSWFLIHNNLATSKSFIEESSSASRSAKKLFMALRHDGCCSCVWHY